MLQYCCNRALSLRVSPSVIRSSVATCYNRCYNNNPVNTSKLVRSPFPDVSIPTGQNLYLFVTKDFTKYGNDVALVDGVKETKISFDQLNNEICNISSSLREMGLTKDEVVAMVSPNNLDFPKVLLATIAAGGVVTAPNPLLSPEDLRIQLASSNARYVATVPLLLPIVRQAIEGLEDKIKKVIIMDDNAETSSDKILASISSMINDSGSKFAVEAVNNKDDLAVILYTSGTTGQAKGVMLTHHGLVANCSIMNNKELVAVTHGQSCLSLLPFFHVYGMVAILLLTLHTGGTQIILPKFEPTLFLSSIQKHRISSATLAPPLILFLAKHPEVSKYDLSCLESVISGAAPLGADLAKEACNRTGISVIRQAYGLSELACHCMPLSMGMAKPSSIGSPFPNVVSKIVDTVSGELLGPHEEGEIVMTGPNLMKGYLNLPEETQRCFDKDGWFRTGDVGYYDDDNHFYITDRLKELIKVKGLSVSPAELEGVLLKHHGIADVAVIGVPNERLGEAPKAFVVRKDNVLTENDVVGFIEESNLPKYKWLHGGVQFVDEIPKSASGKILRRLLK